MQPQRPSHETPGSQIDLEPAAIAETGPACCTPATYRLGAHVVALVKPMSAKRVNPHVISAPSIRV